MSRGLAGVCRGLGARVGGRALVTAPGEVPGRQEDQDVATRSARMSRMRLEVRKEDGASESSSSVPTPKTPSSPATAGACCTGAGMTGLCA